ncbi:hypothetical protein FA13DRAFT_1817225 [Coprinellus micaceus]|uniref:Uncharacterized protein n=1 Tax=Coprinellus micaceus TaxID=71717 RepID=A0A4Y7SVE3_COPMI|nr:hypothetical protein FA13DRAFT_1817225 [Coprinellus micaceus]
MDEGWSQLDAALSKNAFRKLQKLLLILDISNATQHEGDWNWVPKQFVDQMPKMSERGILNVARTDCSWARWRVGLFQPGDRHDTARVRASPDPPRGRDLKSTFYFAATREAWGLLDDVLSKDVFGKLQAVLLVFGTPNRTEQNCRWPGLWPARDRLHRQDA